MKILQHTRACFHDLFRAGNLAVLIATLLSVTSGSLAQPCDPVPAMERPYLLNDRTNCAVSLAWIGRNGVDGYDVARSQGSSSGPYTIVGTVSTNRFLDIAVEPYTNYHYRVRAFNACGPLPYGPSVSVWTTTPTVVPDVRSLAATMDSPCTPIRVVFHRPTPRPSDWRVDVLRSQTQNLADAVHVGTATQSSFVDYGAAEGRRYWYWGQARVGTCLGNAIGPAVGRQFYDVPAAPASPRVSPRYENCATMLIIVPQVPPCASNIELLRGTTPDASAAVSLGIIYGYVYNDSAVTFGTGYYYWTRGLGPGGAGPVSHPTYFVAGSVPPRLDNVHDRYFSPGFDGYLTCDRSFAGGTLQWFLRGVPITDGERYEGATSRSLRIILPTEDEDLGPYTVMYTTECGVAFGGPAYLVPFPEDVYCSPCIADYDQDGGVTGSDVEAFLTDWSNSAFCADVTQDGGVDGQDLEMWLFYFCCSSC